MSWLSQNNKYLKVLPNVILTPTIDTSIAEIDKYFEKCPSFVTSGLRDAISQLRIIRQYLIAKGLDKTYPLAMTCQPGDQFHDVKTGKMVYDWQYAWSNLLNINVIINPPLQAQVLMDYFGPRGGTKNLKGIYISQTNHATGRAYNIGGGNNGPVDEENCIKAAIVDKVKTIDSYLMERENNALHINCKI